MPPATSTSAEKPQPKQKPAPPPPQQSQPLVPHAFVVHTYTTPTYCVVCKKLLWGAVRQGYRCNAPGCAVDAHAACRVEAHKVVPCAAGGAFIKSL